MATKPTGLDTLNVLSFRAIKGMCTKCGQYGHFRYPNLRGDGCPLAENGTSTSCLKATALDKAEGYIDTEPYIHANVEGNEGRQSRKEKTKGNPINKWR